MKTVALFVLAFGLAGCINKPIEEMSYTEMKALSVQIDQRCKAQGVATPSRDYDICIKQEISRESSTRRRRAQAANDTVVCNRAFNTVICN